MPLDHCLLLITTLLQALVHGITLIGNDLRCKHVACPSHIQQFYGCKLVQVAPGMVTIKRWQSADGTATVSYMKLSCNDTAKSSINSSSTSNSTVLMPCTAVSVTNHTQLMQALVASQRISEAVYVLLAANISIPYGQWPATGVFINRNVTIAGMPGVATELDLGLNLNLLRLDLAAGYVEIQGLVLVNLAMDNMANFPSSLLMGAVWAFKFDR